MGRARHLQLAGYAFVLLGIGACSKSPSETATDAAKAVSEMAGPSIVPKDASRQAEKLVAGIDERPECDTYRQQIREAGLG